MDRDTIVGSRRPRFLKPGEKYHLVRETEWEREWEAEGLLPKRWAVASEPVVVETCKPSVVEVLHNRLKEYRTKIRTIDEHMLDQMNPDYVLWDYRTWWSQKGKVDKHD